MAKAKKNTNSKYDQSILKRIKAAAARLRRIYESSIVELSLAAGKITFNGEVFDLTKQPALQQKIESVLRKMHLSIYGLIVNDIKNSWATANDKNNVLVDKRFAGKKLTANSRRIFYDPNLDALNKFTKRKEYGLDLSERIWKTLEGHRVDLERGLSLGISKGQSSKEMATELKRNLNEPDRLFRRVRNEEGKLKLSKAAKEYHPGQGQYRSSYKNAFRLARTETNIAYRMSDFERWQSLPFVVGIEIRLSDNHPKFDICDILAGRYPKNFNWTGWHPQCLCYAVAIQLTEAEFEKYTDSLIGLGEFDGTSVNQVKDPPAEFVKYLKDNIDKLKGMTKPPYWVRDNPEILANVAA